MRASCLAAEFNQSHCTIEVRLKFKLQNNMAVNERLQTLAEFVQEKENLTAEVGETFFIKLSIYKDRQSKNVVPISNFME